MVASLVGGFGWRVRFSSLTVRPGKRQQELTAAIFHQKYSVSRDRGVVGQKKSGQDKQA